jgi:phage-related tail fiber protein
LASDESAAAALTTTVSGKADKATTLAGYGITDAYTKTAVDTALGLKANTSSLATVATSGAYSDLTGKPTLFSGSYTDLTSKPTLFSGVFADLTSKPTTLAGYGVTSVTGGTF